MEITFVFRKIEVYKPSCLGARSIPVDRLTDENLLEFESFKIRYMAGKVSNI